MLIALIAMALINYITQIQFEFGAIGLLAQQQMACALPLKLASRSEPYELVTRKGAQVSPAAKLLFDELVHRRS